MLAVLETLSLRKRENFGVILELLPAVLPGREEQDPESLGGEFLSEFLDQRVLALGRASLAGDVEDVADLVLVPVHGDGRAVRECVFQVVERHVLSSFVIGLLCSL